MPPSTLIVSPVRYAEAGLARKSTTSATSEGRPSRLRLVRLRECRYRSGRAFPVAPPSVAAGATTAARPRRTRGGPGGGAGPVGAAQAVVAARGEFLGRAGRCRAVLEVTREEPRARVGERAGDLPADAPGAAGDQDPLAFEVARHHG